VDDEYASAGAADPKILITTSRDPSSRLAQFAKVNFYRCFFFKMGKSKKGKSKNESMKKQRNNIYLNFPKKNVI